MSSRDTNDDRDRSHFDRPEYPTDPQTLRSRLAHGPSPAETARLKLFLAHALAASDDEQQQKEALALYRELSILDWAAISDGQPNPGFAARYVLRTRGEWDGPLGKL